MAPTLIVDPVAADDDEVELVELDDPVVVVVGVPELFEHPARTSAIPSASAPGTAQLPRSLPMTTLFSVPDQPIRGRRRGEPPPHRPNAGHVLMALMLLMSTIRSSFPQVRSGVTSSATADGVDPVSDRGLDTVSDGEPNAAGRRTECFGGPVPTDPLSPGTVAGGRSCAARGPRPG